MKEQTIIPRYIDPNTNRAFYVPGDIVSVNFEEFSLWPSIIVNSTKIPSNLKRSNTSDLEYIVQTFPLNEDSFSVVPAERILPFQRPENPDAIEAYNEARGMKRQSVDVQYPCALGLPFNSIFVEKTDFEIFSKELNFLEKILENSEKNSENFSTISELIDQEKILFEKIKTEALHYPAVALADNKIISVGESVYAPDLKKSSIQLTQILKIHLIFSHNDKIMVAGSSETHKDTMLLLWPAEMLKTFSSPIFNQISIKYPEIPEEASEESSEAENLPEATEDLPLSPEAISSRIKKSCVFCGGKNSLLGPFAKDPRSKSAQNYHGGPYKGSAFYFHEDCAFYSPEVYRPSKQDLIEFYPDTEELPDLWFNVAEAAKRATKIHCYVCRKNGATIGCWNVDCPRSVHFDCAKKVGWIFSEKKDFYCEKCRNHEEK